MRARPAACGLLLSLVALSVAAQGPAPVPVLEDVAGDVVFLVAEDQEAPTTGHDPVDLLTLGIAEDGDTIWFTVVVSGVASPTPGLVADAARLDVRFRHGGVLYDVGTGIQTSGEGFAELRHRMPGSADRFVGPLAFTMDGAGSFTVEVPRDMLVDENGAPPRRGTALEDLHVDTHAHATGIFLVQPDGSLFQPLGIRDRMPDAGGATYAIRVGGPTVSGPVVLDAPHPFRASNGGAGTFAFEVLLTSLDGDSTFAVDTSFVSAAWTVEHPPEVRVGATPVAVPILVSTPFGHQHGGRESFQIHFRAPGAHASAELGIVYLDIPQPASHHDTVYLHSGAPNAGADLFGVQNGALWMNTLEEDPEDTGSAMSADAPLGPFSEAVTWSVCLDPGLRLGLDMNLSRTGAFRGRVASTGAEGHIEGELVHVTGDPTAGCALPADATVLATLGPSDVFAADGQTVVETSVTPQAAGDRVPPDPTAILGLRLRFVPATPYAEPPELLPMASLALPLDEYMDERPAGLVGGPVVVTAPNGTASPTPTTERASPGVGPGLLALWGALAVAARGRKRRLSP